MKALLDTCTFLWWNLNDPQLSAAARKVIENGDNEIFFSAVSAWEITLKAARGRLILPDLPGRYIAERLAYNHFQALPIQVSHALQIERLPEYHRNHFDRLLIAQAQLENLSLLTADEQIRRYDLSIIW
jgi:PIN domain nuclease of toxin-antitoxin system